MDSATPLNLAREHEERTLEVLYPALAGLAGAFFLFFFLNWFGMREPARTPLMLWDAALVLILGVGAIVVRRRRLSLRTAHLVLGAAGLLAISNVLLAMVLNRDAGNTSYLLLLLMAGGFLVLDTRWLLVFVIPTVLAWVPAVLHAAERASLVHHVSTMVAAVIATLVMHVLRRRMVLRVATLRQLDAERKVELEQALARVERELEERQATEQQRQAEQEMRSQLEQQLQQSQKMEALGTLAGGVAHDINNVLGAIMTLGSLLEGSLPDDAPERSDVTEILAACRRGRDLTRNLLGFARQGQQQRRRFDVNEVVSDVLELLERTTPRRIRIERDLAADLPQVEGDPSQINQALINIALNAIDALEGKGTLAVETTVQRLEDECRAETTSVCTCGTMARASPTMCWSISSSPSSRRNLPTPARASGWRWSTAPRSSTAVECSRRASRSAARRSRCSCQCSRTLNEPAARDGSP
jgi:signal transduction histidine kinase